MFKFSHKERSEAGAGATAGGGRRACRRPRPDAAGRSGPQRAAAGRARPQPAARARRRPQRAAPPRALALCRYTPQSR